MIFLLLGAKGGVGTSLVASNIGILLAREGSSLLLDLHFGSGCDDLLLGIGAKHSWLDLVPVANEINDQHLGIVLSYHRSGLCLIAAAHRSPSSIDDNALVHLIRSLRRRFEHVIIDPPAGMSKMTQIAMRAADASILVSCPDPPALRGAKRIAESISCHHVNKTGLVINQLDRHHPVRPTKIASAIGLPLIGTIPRDPTAVGFQVNYGEACVEQRGSVFRRAIEAIKETMLTAESGTLLEGFGP